MTARILIIDDSRFDRRMIRRAMVASIDTLDVSELSNGSDAAGIIAREKPCITLLDVRMPDVDGFSVLSDIRSKRDLADSVVVMLSGSDEPRDRQMSEELGADAYYVKPESAVGYMTMGRHICKHHLPCAQP